MYFIRLIKIICRYALLIEIKNFANKRTVLKNLIMYSNSYPYFYSNTFISITLLCVLN
jgi:hypothetical protein